MILLAGELAMAAAVIGWAVCERIRWRRFDNWLDDHPVELLLLIGRALEADSVTLPR